MSDSEGSQTRSRRNSYSDDSFHSDDDQGRRNSHAKQNKSLPGKKLPASQSGSVRNLSRNSVPGASHQTGPSNATRRMLSAGRVKISELRNKITELQVQLANVQTENKQLLRQQKQQERILAQYEQQDTDAPTVVQRMGEEANALREQLRRVRDKYNAKCKKLQDVTEELDRTQRLLKKMKTLVDDRKLAERDDLNQKLNKAKDDLVDKDRTIEDLKRHIENLGKNHKHELGIERARHRETQRVLEEMQTTDNRLQMQLREKEKELEVRNIYALRQQRPPHRLDSSINSTPVPPSDSHRQLHRTKLQNIRSETDKDKETFGEDRPRRKRNSEDLGRRQVSAASSRQLEQEQQFLSRLQEDGEEGNRLRAEREQMERERELLQRERERIRQEHERERKEAERERAEAERRHREEEEERALHAREEADRLRNSTEEQERLRQKEILLAKMKAIDEGMGADGDVSVSKSYQNGIAPRGKRQPIVTDEVEGAIFGEYRPSFLAGSTTSVKPTKKISVSEKKPRELPKDEILFFEPENGKSASPELSFLGGDTGNIGNGDQLLPRRPRQNATVIPSKAKSDTKIIDDDDDIEEVIL